MKHAKQLEAILTNRKTLAYTISKLDLNALNKVPDGYNNNILWNLGHLISVSQSLIYGLGGEKYRVDKEVVKRFAPGTQPEVYTQDDLDLINSLLVSSIEALIEDCKEGKFSNYKEYLTRTRFMIDDLESALLFNVYHEGYHMGIIVRLLNNL